MTKNIVFPYSTEGEVVKGFGRGSKELGIPTANFPEDVVDKLPPEFKCGIYYGLASVENGPLYKMVMSIGYNPYYKNEKRSMETHLIHVFDEDFYGSLLNVCIVGWIRPEENFPSLESLIKAIKADINTAVERLDDNTIMDYTKYFSSMEPAQNGHSLDHTAGTTSSPFTQKTSKSCTEDLDTKEEHNTITDT